MLEIIVQFKVNFSRKFTWCRSFSEQVPEKLSRENEQNCAGGVRQTVQLKLVDACFSMYDATLHGCAQRRYI